MPSDGGRLDYPSDLTGTEFMRLLWTALLLALLSVPASAQQTSGFQFNAASSISATGTSANAVLPGSGSKVLIQNTGANTAYLAFGGSTIAATTSGMPLVSGECIYEQVTNYTYIAAITATSTTTVLLTQGDGNPPLSCGGTGTSTVTGTVTANQGTAAAYTAPWPVMDGQSPSDTTGSFTGTGAATINATIDGFASAKIQIKGTYAAFTVNTLASSDGGTTFVPLQCAMIDGSQFGTAFTLTANQSAEIACGHQSGDDTLQLQTSAGPASGTANVDISASAFPSDDGNTTGTVILGSTGNKATVDSSGNIHVALGNSASTANAATSALASNEVVCNAACSLYSFDVSADSTLSAAAWWIMIFNATSLPGNGAVTPARCIALPSGSTAYTGAFPVGLPFATGVVIGVSTSGCFSLTASAHAFIAGDGK